MADSCLVYARMSSADLRRARQGAHGDIGRLDELITSKIRMHLQECRQYAAGQGWQILGEYTDNMISGSSRYRQLHQKVVGRDELLRELKLRAGQRTYVLSTEVERLYRDTDESRELIRIARRTPITVVSTDDESYDLGTANGEAAFEAAVSKGQRESAKVSERRRRKERTRAAEGGYWGPEPFGHHKVYDSDPATGQRYYTGRLMLCDKSCPGRNNCQAARTPGTGEAEEIQAAAASLINGASLHSIVTDWARRGVRTRNGKIWLQNMIGALLVNKRLIGIRVHRAGDKWGRADRKSTGRETRGLWPAILSDDDLLTIRGILADPGRREHAVEGHSRGAKRHLLAGLAACGKCGATMKVRPTGPKGADGRARYRAYSCPPKPEGCAGCSRSEPTADNWVIAHVLAWLADGGAYSDFLAQEQALREAGNASARQELDDIETQKRAIGARLAGYEAEMRSGKIAPGTMRFNVIMQTIEGMEEEHASLTTREEKIRAAIPAVSMTPVRRASLTTTLADPEADLGERIGIVRQFVQKVIIHPAGRGTRNVFDPATIEVVPRTWADIIPSASLTAGIPTIKRWARLRVMVANYLAEHPGSTSKEVAEATGTSWSSACTVLAKMRDDGEVIPDRPGRGGGSPAQARRYTLPA